MLETIKNEIPHIQRQRSHSKMVGAAQHDKIKSHTCRVGDSQTGEQ